MTHLIIPDENDPAGFWLAGSPVPHRTSDWMRLLVLALGFIATEDIISTPTLFTADVPSGGGAQYVPPDAAAVLHPVAPLLDRNLIPVGLVQGSHDAWIVMNPAWEGAVPDVEEPGIAPISTGSVFLPGIPDLGFEHRAAWAAVSSLGEIIHMRYTAHAKLNETTDLVVLSSILQD